MRATWKLAWAAVAAWGFAALVEAAPVAVSDEGRRAQAPEVAVGRDGSIHVIWLDKGAVGTADRKGKKMAGMQHSHQAFASLMYARSGDGGQTFGAPVRVNHRDGEVWGFSISKASLAVDTDGQVHILYPANATSSTTGLDVASSAYTVSTDGVRFSPAEMVNTDPEDDLSELVSGGLAQAQVFGTLSASAEGAIHAFWLDTRDMNVEDKLSSLFMRSSYDGGASWGPERDLFSGDACPCCQVTSTVSEKGTVYVSARKVSGEKIRTPFVAASHDRGSSFGPRVSTGGKPWQLDGCPLKANALATSGNHLYSLVHNGAEDPPGLLFARSPDEGASFEAAHPIHPGADVSDSPSLAASGARVVAVWHAKEGGPRAVYYRVSNDHGARFGPVMRLTQGEAVVGYPEVVKLPDDGFALVWQQDERIMYQALALDDLPMDEPLMDGAP